MSFEIGKETSPGFNHGHKTVGTTAVKLTTLAFSCDRGVLLRCPGSSDPVPNTDPIWVGSSATVTANINEGTGGIPIPPGEALVIPVDSPDKVWVISTAASQDVAWMGV